ncbi:hypothetical protein L218DRAFT_1003333 [Marasmius fiardii PR-910]|nr:hypothetical protein L218DRAFT_1003333 [Marasmius fiardii PR-910]
METVQVSITRPSGHSYTPVQHNTTINGSYNNSTRSNQGSNNHILNDGGWRLQDTEMGGWEGIEGDVRRHDPLPSSKSDGDQWEPHRRAEHEAISTSYSAPPAIFAQPQAKQPPPNVSSTQLDTQVPQRSFRRACPTCGQPWSPQSRATMQDNDHLQPSHRHPEYNNPPVPSTPFDDIPHVHHPFEDNTNRYWPAERSPEGVHDIKYDHQVQPLLFNQDDHDDTPASSQRITQPFTVRFFSPAQAFQGSQSFHHSNDPHFLPERPVESSARPHTHLRYTSNGQDLRFTGRSSHIAYGHRSEHLHPPRKYVRDVAVDYDVRVSAGTRSPSRIYTDERLNVSEPSFFSETDKQAFSVQYPSDTWSRDGQDHRDVVVDNAPSTLKSHNPFRNRDFTTTTSIASAAVGRTFFAL